MLSAIPAILVGKIIGIRLITFVLFVLGFISLVFGIFLTGSFVYNWNTWSEFKYKVRPAFAVAGIVVIVLFILGVIYSMYNVVFIER